MAFSSPALLSLVYLLEEEKKVLSWWGAWEGEREAIIVKKVGSWKVNKNETRKVNHFSELGSTSFLYLVWAHDMIIMIHSWYSNNYMIIWRGRRRKEKNGVYFYIFFSEENETTLYIVLFKCLQRKEMQWYYSFVGNSSDIFFCFAFFFECLDVESRE